jgi:hypothetical protein
MDPRLRPGPHGFVLWRDAAELGLEHSLRAAVRTGHLVRVRSGVYRVPEAGDERRYGSVRHAELVHAAALSLRRPVFTAYSAAALFGLPILSRWPTDVYVRSTTGPGHRSPGVVHVGSVHDDEPVMVDGVLATSIEVTLIQLARMASLRDALAATDAALRSARRRSDPPPLTTIDRLRSVHDELGPYRGRRRVGAVLARATDLSDSVLETDSRLLFEHFGYAEPELQHRIALPEIGRSARLDFWWPGPEAAAEADGRGKYRRDSLRSSIETVIAEKDRENAIRRRVRAFDRWDWADRRAVTPVLQRLDAMGVPRSRRPIAVL